MTIEGTRERLEDIDAGLDDRSVDGSIHEIMARPRREAPVHRCARNGFGSFWSATLFADQTNAKLHPDFVHGVHLCVGARIAELQLDALLTEMAAREMKVAVDGPVRRKAHHQLPRIEAPPVGIARA